MYRLIAVVTIISFCFLHLFAGENSGNSRIATDSTMALTVMSFNVWNSGGNVSNGDYKIVNAVMTAGADMVCLSEAGPDITATAARRLGWHHYSTSHGDAILSRFPIIKSWETPAAAGAEISISDNMTIAVLSAHLYYTPYGPYRACFDGLPVDQIIEEETTSGRLPEINEALQSVDEYLKKGIPVFLAGDFNTPSHQDWTAATADEHCGYVIEWPVTRAVTDSGLTDSYREFFPDPANNPGITWSPLYLHYIWNTGKPEPLDRIDYVFYSKNGPQMLESSTLVIGQPGQYPDYSNNRWPSDHAAVVSTFLVPLGGPSDGRPRTRFYADSVVIYEGQQTGFHDRSLNEPQDILWHFPGGTPSMSNDPNPLVTYDSAGVYTASLQTSNGLGSDSLTVHDFVLVKHSIDSAQISTSKKIYDLKETIGVLFSGGPGNPGDWIGIYKAGQNPGSVSALHWSYVNGQKTPGQARTAGTIEFSRGLSVKGRYWAGFFENDSYILMDSVAFEIADLTTLSPGKVHLPLKPALKASPNPFNSQSRIQYVIPQRAAYELVLYDLSGAAVRSLAAGTGEAGVFFTTLSAAELASGIYVLSLKVNSTTVNRKIVLVK